jgi:hypothetical protein
VDSVNTLYSNGKEDTKILCYLMPFAGLSSGTG